MPLPVALLPALASGATLVPHVSGGLIASGSSGYIAGTFLSSTAVTSILAGGATTLTAGAVYAGSTLVGSAGVFGTTVGATGITGLLMSAGIISSTPVWVPVATALSTAALGSTGFYVWRLNRKLSQVKDGKEVQFTDWEARIIEKIILWKAKKGTLELGSEA